MVNVSINGKQKLLTVNSFINGKWLSLTVKTFIYGKWLLWTGNSLDIFPKNKLLLLLLAVI